MTLNFNVLEALVFFIFAVFDFFIVLMMQEIIPIPGVGENIMF